MELTTSMSPRKARASARCRNPLRTAGTRLCDPRPGVASTPTCQPGLSRQPLNCQPHFPTWEPPKRYPTRPGLAHRSPAGTRGTQTRACSCLCRQGRRSPRTSTRLSPTRLTVADPALGRVLSGKQLELGLEGPGLHAGAVQPLQHLHEHFDEKRREARVLGHAALWDNRAHGDAAQGRPGCGRGHGHSTCQCSPGAPGLSRH